MGGWGGVGGEKGAGGKGGGGAIISGGKHLPPLHMAFDVFQEKKTLETLLVFPERSRVC